MEEKMRIASLAACLVLSPLMAVPAHAEESGRYRLEKSSDGYVRMDTETGAMSICNERDGQLVCRVAADERSAFQDEMDRLQDKVASLDERVTTLENSLTQKLESSLPSEEDFNRTMGFMERFLRSFMGIVKDMEKDEPTPQKT